jgi:hypothetical protein
MDREGTFGGISPSAHCNMNAREVLTAAQVDSILLRAWTAFSARPKPLSAITRSDWDELSADVERVLNSAAYPPGTFLIVTGDGIAKRVGNAATRRTKSIFTILFYVLIKEDKILIKNSVIADEEIKKELLNFEKNPLFFVKLYAEKIGFSDSRQAYQETQNLTNEAVKNIAELTNAVPKQAGTGIQKFAIILSVSLVVASLFFWAYSRNVPTRPVAKEVANLPVALTVTNATNQKIAPCELEFAYDASEAGPGDAFIDFNDYDTPKLIPLSNRKGTIKHAFTHPQGRLVSLYVGNTYRNFRVLINSDGWFLKIGELFMLPIRQGGVMHYPLDDIPAPLLRKGEFYTYYQILNDFNINADSVQFEARVKNPQKQGGITCFDVTIDLNGQLTNTEKLGMLSFNVMGPGCERHAVVKVGDTELYGKDSSRLMRPSTIDLSDWVTIKAVVQQHVLRIYLNGQLRHTVPYKGQIGTLKFMQVGFKGTGSIDWVRLSTPGGQRLYQEEFN